MTDRLPSQEYEKYWIRAENPHAKAPVLYTGKWLLYVPVSELDNVWAQIREATENGRLGTSAKTATMVENPNARSRYKVMCVYTHDCRDLEDVTRVLRELRSMGFNGRLYYKEDLATHAGNYQSGHASLYESPEGDTVRQRRTITDIPDSMVREVISDFES